MEEETLIDEANFQDKKITDNTREKQHEFYNGVSAQYREEHLDNLLGDVKNIKLLDLGAGNGWYTLRMLEKGANVCAIDISPKSIEKIDEDAAEYKEKGMYCGYVMDATNMTFDDNTFDVVVGHGILHHLLNYDKTIKEILRVLKPGGHAYFYEPLGMNPLVNLYRHITPKARTENEKPLDKNDIRLIKSINPLSKFTYFEMLSLLSKPFIVLKAKKLAGNVEKAMLNIDKKLLNKNSDKPSFAQRMAWIVLIQLEKEKF